MFHTGSKRPFYIVSESLDNPRYFQLTGLIGLY